MSPRANPIPDPLLDLATNRRTRPIPGVPIGTKSGDITRSKVGVPEGSKVFTSFEEIPLGEKVKLQNGIFIVKGGTVIDKDEKNDGILRKRSLQDDNRAHAKECSYLDSQGSPGGVIWLRKYFVGCRYYFFQPGDSSQSNGMSKDGQK